MQPSTWPSCRAPPRLLGVELRSADFNNAGKIIAGKFSARWKDLEDALGQLPLHLKASDQKGKVGRPIFDPVGTNAAIKRNLEARKWPTNIPIPEALDFLGTDVDFFSDGLLVEAQFSNYPFFLNNVVRSALLAKSKTKLAGKEVEALIVICKAHMFPASNSTLYFEQAVKQMTEFAKYGVFDVPTRLVGLFSPTGKSIPAIWTSTPGRYSRDLSGSGPVTCVIEPGPRADSICTVAVSRPRR